MSGEGILPNMIKVTVAFHGLVYRVCCIVYCHNLCLLLHAILEGASQYEHSRAFVGGWKIPCEMNGCLIRRQPGVPLHTAGMHHIRLPESAHSLVMQPAMLMPQVTLPPWS